MGTLFTVSILQPLWDFVRRNYVASKYLQLYHTKMSRYDPQNLAVKLSIFHNEAKFNFHDPIIGLTNSLRLCMRH